MVPPAKRYRYDPYPRTFKFAKVAPMAAMDTPGVAGSRGRSNGRSTRSSYRSGRSGPYQALVQNNFHTHPVYPRPEVKTSDVDQAGAAFTGAAAPTGITSSGTVVVLNALAQGGEINARIGQQVSTRNCSYRYELDLPLPPNAVPTSGRVMLIWDRQPNTAVAAFTDIFTSASYLAYVLPGGAQRFVILRNQQFSLSPNGDQTLFFEGYVKINMTSTYVPETVSNNPNSGALLLAFIADQTAAAQRPTISGCFRTRFIDN